MWQALEECFYNLCHFSLDITLKTSYKKDCPRVIKSFRYSQVNIKKVQKINAKCNASLTTTRGCIKQLSPFGLY